MKKEKPFLNQPVGDGRKGEWADHTHTCCRCGHEFACLEFTEEECRKKGVFNAAKVNKDGPYCELCRNLEMALRYAESIGLTVIAGAIRVISKQCEKIKKRQKRQLTRLPSKRKVAVQK